MTPDPIRLDLGEAWLLLTVDQQLGPRGEPYPLICAAAALLELGLLDLIEIGEEGTLRAEIPGRTGDPVLDPVLETIGSGGLQLAEGWPQRLRQDPVSIAGQYWERLADRGLVREGWPPRPRCGPGGRIILRRDRQQELHRRLLIGLVARDPPGEDTSLLLWLLGAAEIAVPGGALTVVAPRAESERAQRALGGWIGGRGWPLGGTDARARTLAHIVLATLTTADGWC